MNPYSIEVSLESNEKQNPYNPYFWVIFETLEQGSKCNTGICGWSETPSDAWEEAYNNYKLLFECK